MRRNRAGKYFIPLVTLWVFLVTWFAVVQLAKGDDDPVTIMEREMQGWTPTWYPEGHGPETPEQRADRWRLIAQTIDSATRTGRTFFWPEDEIALLMVIWKFESSLDYHVHGGEPSPIGHQDRQTSRCLGQIKWVKAWWSEDEWLALAGRDAQATRRCADATLRVLAYHAQRCRLRRDLPRHLRGRAPMREDEANLLLTAYGDGTSCTMGREVRTRQWALFRSLF